MWFNELVVYIVRTILSILAISALYKISIAIVWIFFMGNPIASLFIAGFATFPIYHFIYAKLEQWCKK